MPPSPAMRCSPGRETRANNHKRGHSFEGGLIFRDKDDDLALFSELQIRERENFLLQSSDDLEATFSSKLRHFSDIKLGISIPARGQSSDLLNVDGEKNDYDWLLTPPDTPLFPSLDDEPPQHSAAHRGRPRSQPISISRSSTMEKSYRSSRGSASPNRLSPSPRSGSSTLQSRGRPSSARHSSPSPSLRHATPSRRPSTPPSKPSTPVPRSSTPTPRRMSTGSGGSVASSGIRGVSPVKTSRGTSASPKIRAWQTNIPGFSSDAPPNLRTSLADRPATYVRGSSPATRNGRRQSMSPTASRSVSSSHSHDRDPFSSHSRGSIASSGDDDVDSIQSMHVGSLDRPTSRRVASFSNNRAPALSKNSTKTASPSSAPKRSFDSAIRQMDHRKSPQNMFRPLLSSVPSTTFYVGKASSAHRSLISRNSSVTTSSNASSDQGTSAALDTEGSDHNQDDVANEFAKVPFMEVPEEVFAFDRMDVVNEAAGHETTDKSVDINSGDFDRDSKTDFGLAEPRESCNSGIVTEVGPTSEASLVNNDFSEVDSPENMAICSRCGCRYHAYKQEERDTRLCPQCNIKEKLSRVTTLETAVAGDTSLVLSTNTSEEKPSDDLTSGIAAAEQITEVKEPKSFQDEENVAEANASYSKQSRNYLQENSLARSEVEGGEDRLAKQKQEGMLAVGHNLPDNDAGDQKLHHSIDYPSLRVDISEGTGISVLLKRTSSSKGHVVQGRTFSAASIPYDNLSYSKDSASSMRSSIGHGSFSTSSSVDFGSRQIDSRVQRQLSGKKLDVEYHRSDKSTKPQSTGSSFSGITNLANQAVPLSRSTHEDNFQVSIGNMEYVTVQETDVASQGHLLAPEHTDADATDTSSTRAFLVGEDGCDYGDSSRAADVSTSELPNPRGSGSEVKLVEPLSSSEPSALHNGETPKDANGMTEYEVLDKIRGFSSKEEHAVLNVDGVDGAEIANRSSMVTMSEIEIENHRRGTPGSLSDNISLASKSTTEESLEASPSDKDVTASALESKTFDCEHDIREQESTIMVESQGGRKARSLTLEEATDTILFCRSIVHDLAYQAATIAMEKEISDPFEGSQPKVTILGKSNYNKRDPPRGRTFGNRSPKPQKTKKKWVETEAKPPISVAENDENAVEPLQRNVRSPNKVDSMKPPKLESKCNCTIM